MYDRSFNYDIGFKKAKNAHKNKYYLESIGIIFANIAVTMNDIAQMSGNEQRNFEFLRATKYLYDDELIDYDFKIRLDGFRRFRNDLNHNVLLHKRKITGKKLNDKFEEGLIIHDEIIKLGNYVSANTINR